MLLTTSCCLSLWVDYEQREALLFSVVCARLLWFGQTERSKRGVWYLHKLFTSAVA